MARILHLSDLHLRTEAQADTALGQLCSDLKGELAIESLDSVIISGDCSELAQPPEYDAITHFLTKLCNQMRVSKEHLLVVPGNHDVDWQASKASYTIVRTSDAPSESVSQYQDPGNRDYVEIATDADLYQRRFANYAAFHYKATGRRYSLNYSKQFEIVVSADNSVIMVGLNSAWNVDHFHRNRSSIEAGALNRALEAAKEKARELGPHASIVAVWHHPSTGDGALKDNSFFQRMVVDGVITVLHGHIHKADTEQFNYEWTARGRKLYILGAGTFDSPDVHRGYPWQYNLLSITDSLLELRSRGKSERNGAWHPDARFLAGGGKPPTDKLRIELMPPPAPISGQIRSSDELPSARTQPLQTVSALKSYLKERQYDAMGYRIAVEAMIFEPNGKVLLQVRGPDCRDEIGKLECLGGQVSGEDMIEVTIRRIRELVGEDVTVEVDEVLDVQPARFVEKHGPEDWIVVAYLCRLISGQPRPMNPRKTAALKWLDLSELHAIDDAQLSRSTSHQRDIYRVKFRTKPYFSRAGNLA